MTQAFLSSGRYKECNSNPLLRTMPLFQPVIRLIVLASVLVIPTGCVTTGKLPSPPPERQESDWVMPSRALAGDIEDHAEAIPWTHGRERVDLISWFATIGEPAYDTLLVLLDDERPEVVGTVLAALGATGDSRLVPYLREAAKPSWKPELKLESARARVRLGDWQAMPILIDGLESEQHYRRALCAQTLLEATSEDKGFSASASLPEREEAVSRWRGWWQRRSSDELLLSRAD